MHDLDILDIDGTDYETEVPRSRLRPYGGPPEKRDVRTVIPGTVVEVLVREGEKVGPEQVLLLLDAMKMHNEICAGIEGRVRQVLVRKGDKVEKNQLLIALEH
jgi:biotin carboxyl carrier protein